MPRTLGASFRASETLTIRLTKQHTRWLDQVARAEGLTATDLIRNHICTAAARHGFNGESEGREPSDANLGMTSAPSANDAAKDFVSGTALSSLVPAREIEPEVDREPRLGALIDRYRASFADRGEGTRRELEEALRFFADAGAERGDGILPAKLPLSQLTSERLAEVRERVRRAPLRLSRKNLYLTYLRMMLHFGFKRGEVAVDVAPGAELRGITAQEVDEPWGAASEAPQLDQE